MELQEQKIRGHFQEPKHYSSYSEIDVTDSDLGFY